MTIDFYNHVISPPARACIITAQVLGVEMNIKDVDLFGGATRAPEYLKINPSHTVPTLSDNGFNLFESRAIMMYLANKYAPNNPIYPQDPAARAAVDKVLFYDASGFYASLKTAFIPIFRRKEQPEQAALDDLKEKIEILEKILGEQKFFAGANPTLADISLAVSVPVVKALFPTLWTPALQAWYERVEVAIPQVKKLHTELEAHMAPFRNQ